MTYLRDFTNLISSRNYPSFLRLWEEYCLCDELDPLETKEILNRTKNSEFLEPFGKYVENILPLWELLPESPDKHTIFKLIVDIETNNDESLRLRVLSYLEAKYPGDPNMLEKIRLTGLRGKEKFQGSVANFELLTHLKKGNFVFHTGGWGVGEILDVSMVREELSVEFEHVAGKKHLSFANAFKTLIPIPDDHFLALRFGHPDALEKQAKENPAEVIRLLLRDLGPKTAGEIKDELCELVIPEEEWGRWWQTARLKIKKDTMIASPEELKDAFVLRSSEVSHEDRLRKLLEESTGTLSLIQLIYSFSRDFSEMLKSPEFKSFLYAKAQEGLSSASTEAEKLALNFFLEDFAAKPEESSAALLVRESLSIENLVQMTDILAFKKRLLMLVRRVRPDWKEIFLSLLLTIEPNSLRDYLFSELSTPETQKDLVEKLHTLLQSPTKYPQALIWYFQKITSQKDIPFSDAEGKSLFFEAFFVALHHVEQLIDEKDLVKKMHHILTDDRYSIVRDILKTTSLASAQELLLLATKCFSLSDHDIKILHSLAEVVHPALGKTRKTTESSDEDNTIWTTEAGFNKVKKRMEEIATVETIANAKDIEVARAHGDLRENAEFKAALEKRARLQTDLKTLSDQVGRCRIITPDDISTEEVSVGCSVTCKSPSGKTIQYTLLGPWDADVEKGIISFQSKLAQEMKGLAVGDKFQFQGEELTISAIQSYLEKKPPV